MDHRQWVNDNLIHHKYVKENQIQDFLHKLNHSLYTPSDSSTNYAFWMFLKRTFKRDDIMLLLRVSNSTFYKLEKYFLNYGTLDTIKNYDMIHNEKIGVSINLINRVIILNMIIYTYFNKVKSNE